MPGEWSATVRWDALPDRPDTMTASSTDAWFAKRQARLWAQCPGAVSVELSGPDGAVVAKWDRDGGWQQ